MTNFNLKVLMEAGHSQQEAMEHLKKGTIVYDDLEEHFWDYVNEWQLDSMGVDALWKMIVYKIAPVDWDCVEFHGKWYYIEYCL